MSEPDKLTDGVDEVLQRLAALFDGGFYLERNPDVASIGLDPLAHYLTYGWREGRDPTPWFSVADYLAANPDVANAGLEPFEHYMRWGRDDGRALAPRTPPPAPEISLEPVAAEFDADFYLSSGPRFGITAEDAFSHFLSHGWREGRDPNRWFSVRRYLDVHADIAASGTNPFVHYILWGRTEGRALEHGLGFRFDLVKASANFETHVQTLRRTAPDREISPPEDLEEAVAAIANGIPLHVTVSHDDYTITLGGVQLCLKLEGEAMRGAGAAHIHLFPGRAAPVLDVDREHPCLGVLIDDRLIGFFDFDAVEAALKSIAADRTISIAVHSLIAHRADAVIQLLQRLEAASRFYWLHDFSSLCSNFALMRNDVEFCGPPPPESAACEVCVYGARRQVQLAEHVALMDALDPVVVAPSASAMSIWRSRFPSPDKKGVIHPHLALGCRSRARPGQERDGSVLRVAFLGMPTSHKGWPVFVELTRRFQADGRYEFHHLAKATDPTAGAIWTMVEPRKSNRTPMVGAVRKLEIDVAIIWSLWPETFCFAAYEAVAGGAKILTHPGAGNVFDFVRSEGHGMVLSDEGALVALFESGAALEFSRSRRDAELHTLIYSRMTADLILDPVV